jgi:ubiquinone/menaquinone biosynthesis C-methylase UbiE
MNSLLAAALRLFFRLLYHPLAWTYDGVAALVSLGRWRRWQLAVLPELGGERILELGHGPGHLQVTLRRRGKFVVGLDASRQMGRLARRNFWRARIAAGAGSDAPAASGQLLDAPRLVRGYAQYLPFPDAAFDHLLATFPTEYILDRRTLAEAARLLRPGGSLVILPGAWITGGSPAERAARWLFRITGQDPHVPPRLGEPFEAAGLRLETERISQPGSEILILVAHKSEIAVK